LPEPAPAKAGGAFYGAAEFGPFFNFLRVHQSFVNENDKNAAKKYLTKAGQFW